MCATWTQVIDQKLNAGAYSICGGGALQQGFFLKHVVRPSKKKSTAAFATPGKIPQISPETPKFG